MINRITLTGVSRDPIRVYRDEKRWRFELTFGRFAIGFSWNL